MGPERRLWIAYAVMALMVIGVGATAVQSVRATTASAEELVTTHFADMLEIERLRSATERESRCVRGYVLSPSEESLQRIAEAQRQVQDSLAFLGRAPEHREHALLVANVAWVEERHVALLREIVAARGAGPEMPPANGEIEARLSQTRNELDDALTRLALHEKEALDGTREAGRRTSNRALQLLSLVALAAMLIAGGLGVSLARALRTLRGQQTQLERSNRELDAFAGQVAHDLRNVLSPVFISTSQIRMVVGENQTVDKNLDRLDRAGRRATRMLDGMLAFARAVGAPDPSVEASVRSVVGEVVEDLAGTARKLDATVETDVADVRVHCSPAVLHVVISNAVSNSLKAVEGRPERRVHIGAKPADGTCELTVTDTGVGIPPEHLPHVFEPFFRVPGTKAKGTGIGLTTVQRVVEAHGGTVALEPAPGGGTVFRVRLPLRQNGSKQS